MTTDAKEKSSLFDKLGKLLKQEKTPERRLVRHPQEKEIIDIAQGNLRQSELGQELLDFLKEKDIQISVLRGRVTRDFAPGDKAVYITVADNTPIEDPDITIYLVGAIREAAQEYDQMLKKIPFERGESLFIQREEAKLQDKLIWQTNIVYELGKLANKTEFIDSFAAMGYYNLIEAYEKDLLELNGS